MIEIPEVKQTPEKQEEVRVMLHFFRHAKPERDLSKANKDFELVHRGRTQAVVKSGLVGGKRDLKHSVAIGSPRQRSLHTAALAMSAGHLDGVTGLESYTELLKKIPKGKIRVNPLLDFHLDKNTPFGSKAYKALFSDKNYLQFLVDQSDDLARKEGDVLASTYSRQAGNVARIIKESFLLANRLSSSAERKRHNNVPFERFLGTHGGVGESFLLKVIEKINGKGERNRLIDLIHNQFDYTEGFDVAIMNRGKQKLLHISYRHKNEQGREKGYAFDQDVPVEVIDQIIEESNS